MSKIIKIDCTSFEFTIKPIGNEWYFYVWKHTNGCRVLMEFFTIDREDHKRIADFIEMPWEYYLNCLDEYWPDLLMGNVNYWLKDKGLLRCLESITIDPGVIFNLKEKI